MKIAWGDRWEDERMRKWGARKSKTNVLGGEGVFAVIPREAVVDLRGSVTNVGLYWERANYVSYA